ncbi:MAG: 30S ribosomal protein S27ae [Nanoarchaeota archaeon]
MTKAKEKKKSTAPSKKWDMLKEGRKNCPKCGKGVYMGKYSNPERFHCGKCSYTEFLSKKE